MPQHRSWVGAAAALVGGGAVAVLPATAPLPGLHQIGFQLISGAQDITIDFVRHAQSVDNAEGTLGTAPPGAPLTELGQQQADNVAPLIQAAFPNGIDGIYTSELIRTQETAQALVDLLGAGPRVLSGLDEVNAGFLDGAPLNTFTEIGYVLPQLMWILGLYFVPMPGSAVDPNGMAFQDRVSDAVQTIYHAAVTDPDRLGTSIAFSSAGTIAAWTLMNVKNPDFALALNGLIETRAPVPNTGQVVIEGSPQDGWTLVSWNGADVSPQPDLLTSLFVGLRNAITVPQMALWHLWENIVGAGPPSPGEPVPAGFGDVLGGIGAVLTDAAAGVAPPLSFADLPAS